MGFRVLLSHGCVGQSVAGAARTATDIEVAPSRRRRDKADPRGRAHSERPAGSALTGRPMRTILRSPAPLLLLILTIPVEFILFTLARHSQPRGNFAVFQITSIAFILIGLAVAILGGLVGSAIKRRPLDELMVEINLS